MALIASNPNRLDSGPELEFAGDRERDVQDFIYPQSKAEKKNHVQLEELYLHNCWRRKAKHLHSIQTSRRLQRREIRSS